MNNIEILKDFLEENNLSQAQFAKLFNKDTSLVSKYLSGERPIPDVLIASLDNYDSVNNEVYLQKEYEEKRLKDQEEYQKKAAEETERIKKESIEKKADEIVKKAEEVRAEIKSENSNNQIEPYTVWVSFPVLNPSKPLDEAKVMAFFSAELGKTRLPSYKIEIK